PAGYPIVVPAGTYDFGGSDLTASNRRWVFQGEVTFPSGSLVAAIVQRVNDDGTLSFGTGGGVGGSAAHPSSAKYKFGRTINNQQASGVQIGGADPDEGSDGIMQYADGYGGWITFQPSR